MASTYRGKVKNIFFHQTEDAQGRKQSSLFFETETGKTYGIIDSDGRPVSTVQVVMQKPETEKERREREEQEYFDSLSPEGKKRYKESVQRNAIGVWR